MTGTMALFLAISLYATDATFEKGIGWLSFRDLTSESFSEKFDKYRNEGYRMIDLDGYETSSGEKYSML